MKVKKRNGELVPVSFDKVIARIQNLSQDLSIDAVILAQKVCQRIVDGIQTRQLDEFASNICSSLIIEHPDYDILAKRIIVSNHHKNTPDTFKKSMTLLWNNKDIHGKHSPLISEEIYKIVKEHHEEIEYTLDYTRDFELDYFGFKTLERAYLLRTDNEIVERPQHLFMRVSLGIHGFDFKSAFETYNHMSNKDFVHATPTLFNSGTPRPQMSSCYLIAMKDDSIDGIFDTLKESALISKYAGGIGIHIHNIRSRDSIIRGTNGISTGIVPMLRVFNNTARYVNQCFTPDTIVYTKDGAKEIQNINDSDFVITNDGSLKKVNEVIINNVNKEILKIKTTHNNNYVRVTKEHQIYVI